MLTTGHLSSRLPIDVDGGLVVGSFVCGVVVSGGNSRAPPDDWWPALLRAHSLLSPNFSRRTPTRSVVGVLRSLPIECGWVSVSVGHL